MKSIAKISILLITLLFSINAAFAQAASFTVRAPGQVVEGSRFTVTFRIVNGESQLSRAQAPQLKNCTLVYGPGVSTMQSSTYANGHVESTVIRDYTFTYHADKAGTTTVPSLTVKEGGRTLTTKKATITILPPDKSSSQQRSSAPGYYDDDDDVAVAQPETKIGPNDLIVTVDMSKSRVYENEAVIASIRVYTKHDISSFRATTLPSFDGFLSEELPVNEQPHLVHFRGDNYYTVLLKKCLLYPQKSGKLTINSGQYDVTLQTYEIVSNGFFATRRPVQKNITTKSNSVSVNVTPLPEPRPAGFNGAVGTQFAVKNSLEPSLLRTNEAATYTLTVTGTGNIKYLTVPDIDFGAGVEEYEPESTTDTKFNGTDLTGTFTATYTFVPQNVGKLDVAEQTFVYFNPQTSKYVTLKIPAVERNVIKGSSAPAAAVAPELKEMNDILYIKSLKGAKFAMEHHRAFHDILYILCYIIVIAGLVGAVIVYRRHLRLSADIQGRKTARANRVANKRLRVARAKMKEHDNEGFYDAIASAMWGYIGDKLGIPSSALTRDNISEKLLTAGVSQELVDQTIKVLDECEMARFTPQHSDSEITSLYDEAEKTISELDAVKRR